MPMARAFSSTTILRAPATARRTSSAGHGRNVVMPTAPIRWPSLRSSSTVSFTVPSTDPRATTIVSASSVRYGRTSPPEFAPERLAERPADVRNDVEGLHLGHMPEVADLHERLGADHGADRHRRVRVEHLTRFERWEERIDLLLRGEVDLFDRVGEDEAVHAHHHRKREFLGKPERLDVQIERFLIALGVHLDPSGIPLRHGVRVVVPDVDRSADRAVCHRHDDGQPETGSVVDRLHHEQQSLARGGGVRARPGG